MNIMGVLLFLFYQLFYSCNSYKIRLLYHKFLSHFHILLLMISLFFLNLVMIFCVAFHLVILFSCNFFKKYRYFNYFPLVL